MISQGEITRILAALRGGNSEAMGDLFTVVYSELQRIAHRRLARHSPGETLNTTALVHEAYLKLVDQSGKSWQDRAHFFALAAKVMRQVLVDYARMRLAKKRGGGAPIVAIEDQQLASGQPTTEILALDEALNRLAELNERLSKIVELRFFAGLSVEETANVLDVSTRTVKRDWRKARAFLYRALHKEEVDS